jgi:membrane protease YdiL (CAAX protease family)
VPAPSPVRAPGRLAAWLLFVLLLAAIAYAGRLGGGGTPDDLAYRYTASVAALIQYALMLGALLLIARGLPWREAFALRFPSSPRRTLGLTALTLLVIWGASAALAPFLDATDEQGLVPDEWDPSRAGAFVAFFAVVTFVAPVVEELTFRGLGFSLLAPYGLALAVLTTSVLFALAHGLVAGLPVLTVFGVGVAYLRARSGSVYPGMLLHAVFNATALVVSVAAA